MCHILTTCPDYAPCFVYVGGMASTRAQRAKRSGQTQTPVCMRAEFSLKETEEEGRDQPNDKLTTQGDIPRFLTQVKSVTRHKAKGRSKEGRKEGRKVGERTRKQEKGKTH